MRKLYNSLLMEALAGKELSREKLLYLLETDGRDEQQALFNAADTVRARYMGDEVHLRGVIEFSNYCRQDCHYCGLRSGNTKLNRYRLLPGEILSIAQNGAALGYKTIVLQSGEDPWYSADVLCQVVADIKEKCDVAVTVCCGEFSREDYARLKEAGADRYLLKHETANRRLYRELHPGMSFDERIRCLGWLRELGFQVGSGNMVGLPGQTLADLADDILLLRELDVEMAGIGPFIPHHHTPLARCTAGKLDLVLKVVALTRLVMPYVHLPATTALGSIDPSGRQKALIAGANVVMPNITPSKYRENYQIYPNKICITEEPDHCRSCITGIITSLGRKVAEGYGHSPKEVFQEYEGGSVSF